MNMKFRLIGLIFGLAFTVFARAGELSTFRVPFLERKPVIDGTIDPRGWPSNEWSMALQMSGFSQIANEEPDHTLNYVICGYDEDNLYVAFWIIGMDGSAIRCEATKPDTTAWKDESVELHIGVGETPEVTFQFVVNADNIIYDALNRSGKHDNSWNGEWRHVTAKKGDGWMAEMAIPWKTLGLTRAETGQVLRMNFGHNSKLEGETLSSASSWGSTRHESGREMGFDYVPLMPRALLTRDSAVAGATLSAEKDSDEPALRIRGVNPTEKDVSLQYNALKELWNDIGIPAKKWNTVLVPIKTDERGLGSQPVRIRDASGEIVFRHTVPFRSRIGAAITLKKYFPVNYVEVEIATVLPKGAQAKVAITNDEGKVINSVSKSVEGRPEPLRVDISSMPVNQACTLYIAIFNSEGKPITERRLSLTRPPIPAWLGTKAGLSDQPLLPYTPIEARGDTFACLIKDYAFKGRALPASVRSETQELLAAPMRLELTVGGTTTDIAAAPISVTTAKVNRVEWTTLPMQVGEIKVTHAGWMEEDGFMWCEATLEAAHPVTVERLELFVPVRRDYAVFVHGSLPCDLKKTDDVNRLSGKDYSFETFMGIINLRNYERGISVITDDPRPWRPKDRNRCQRIEQTPEAAVIRYEMIGKPTTIKDRKTFSMGFMAMPAKPVDRNQSQRRIIHDVYFNDVALSCGLGGASRAEYPAAGNINLNEGTLEIYAFADFDATYLHPDDACRWDFTRRLWQIETDQGSDGLLFWDSSARGWQFTRTYQKKNDVKTGMPTALPWPQPAWHHVALTWGDNLRLYSDGMLVAETNTTGLLHEVVNLKDAIMRLGKKDKSYRCEFRVAGVRISNRQLPPADMATNGNFSLRPDTIFLQDFTQASEGGVLPPPQKGIQGKLYDSAKIEQSHGRKTLTFGPIPDLSRVEYFGKLGVKILAYHLRWTKDYGSPRVPKENQLPLKALLDACSRNGIKLILYFGYGLGHQMPESRLYEDYWAIQPLYVWAGPGRYYFVTANNAVNYYTDFMLDGIQKLFGEWPIGGMYYDHVQTPDPDQSLHNGSGWIDENGKLQARCQVRPAREYIKRLWAIAKHADPNNFIDSHGSSYFTPARAAWVDQLYIGEVFRPGHKTFNFDVVTILCVGNSYGMPSNFLVYHENLPFTWEQSLTYTMPHDIEPRAVAWKPEQVAVMAKLWQIKDAFDTDHAEWHPYWKTNEYASVTGEGCIMSFHLHPGKRALVVVSNVSGKGPVEAKLKLNLKAMGLKGQAKNTWTGESVVLDNGQATFKLEAHDMRLLWVE